VFAAAGRETNEQQTFAALSVSLLQRRAAHAIMVRTSAIVSAPFSQERKWVCVDSIQAKQASPDADFPCRLAPAVAIGSF
jgi:hypothetical protein